jgi:hypothetical protein
MSGNEREFGTFQLALDDVQIRPADTADGNADKDFPEAGLRHGHIVEPEWIAGYIPQAVENHRLHHSQHVPY